MGGTRLEKGIIFDFNGTLVFDTEAHEKAWHALIPELRGSAFSEEEFKRQVHGHTNREIFSYVFGKPLTEEEALPFGERKEALYRGFLQADKAACRLVPGAEAFFTLLFEAGVPMGIATAAPASNVAFYRTFFGLDRWFSESRIVFADGTLPGKPHPALFLRAIGQLGLSPSQVCIVEDSTLGVQAARASGAGRVIGISADGAGRERLLAMGCHRAIPDFSGADLTLLD